MKVKCLTQEHNTMSAARTSTRTARFRDERANDEATAPPTLALRKCQKVILVQGFGLLETEIARFPIRFRLIFFFLFAKLKRKTLLNKNKLRV